MFMKESQVSPLNVCSTFEALGYSENCMHGPFYMWRHSLVVTLDIYITHLLVRKCASNLCFTSHCLFIHGRILPFKQLSPIT